MKLSIHNLAKIRSADLEFNGITVIAGNNNTGKSTVGRALFALFTAFKQLPRRIGVLRRNYVEDILARWKYKFPETLVDELLTKDLTWQELQQWVTAKDAKLEPSEIDCKQVLRLVGEVKVLSDEKIAHSLLAFVFSDVFHQQYLSLKGNVNLDICLTVQGKNIKLWFDKGILQYEREIILNHDAYLINGTQVLDYLDRGIELKPSNFCGPEEFHLLQNFLGVQEEARANFDRAALYDSLTRDRLTDINNIFEEILGGRVTLNTEGRFVFHDNSLNADIQLINLSTGLKTFTLLHLLLSRGCIEPQDVLILDEPEIHLHPDWQLKYAEIIVLLQKHFDLTILLTSHSPDFINALQLYARHHGIMDKLNAYLSKEENGTVSVVEVNKNNWDALYEKFLPMVNKLELLRVSLED